MKTDFIRLAQKLPSKLERDFDFLWNHYKGQTLVCEYKFHPTRKFRFDRAHIETKTAIELDGGVYQHGRHNRALGFIADRIKDFEAYRLGWTVLHLVGEQINSSTIDEIIRKIKEKTK